MLKKEIIKELEKYSFIDKVERKGVILYLYYSINGETKHEKIPLRANINRLQKLVSDLRNKLGGEEYGRTKVGNYYII